MDITTRIAVYAAFVATGSVYWQILTHRDNRRNGASNVVGRLVALLWSLDPETGPVGGIPGDRVTDAITHYSDQWAPIHADLEALRIAQPRIATEVRDAIDATLDSMKQSFWAMRQDNRAVDANLWDNLKAKYAEAMAAAQTLEEAVRRS